MSLMGTKRELQIQNQARYGRVVVSILSMVNAGVNGSHNDVEGKILIPVMSFRCVKLSHFGLSITANMLHPVLTSVMQLFRHIKCQ